MVAHRYRALQVRRHEVEREQARLCQSEFRELKVAVSCLSNFGSSYSSNQAPARTFNTGGEAHDQSTILQRISDHNRKSDPCPLSVTQNISVIGATNNKPKATNSNYNVPASRKRRRRLVQISTAPWSWLTNRAWELCCYQASSGWNVTIRTYNIIPDDSDAFNFAISGNVSGLQKLFMTGKASPFDVTCYGTTLLDVSRMSLPRNIFLELT